MTVSLVNDGPVALIPDVSPARAGSVVGDGQNCRSAAGDSNPARQRPVLQVSGRASFELILKAAMVGVPILSAVSAPYSLAVDLAAARAITLAGSVRGHSLLLYSRASRVRPD